MIRLITMTSLLETIGQLLSVNNTRLNISGCYLTNVNYGIKTKNTSDINTCLIVLIPDIADTSDIDISNHDLLVIKFKDRVIKNNKIKAIYIHFRFSGIKVYLVFIFELEDREIVSIHKLARRDVSAGRCICKCKDVQNYGISVLPKTYNHNSEDIIDDINVRKLYFMNELFHDTSNESVREDSLLTYLFNISNCVLTNSISNPISKFNFGGSEYYQKTVNREIVNIPIGIWLTMQLRGIINPDDTKLRGFCEDAFILLFKKSSSDIDSVD